MSYTKNTWVTGDIVTAAKLNNIENGVYNNDQNISSEAIARAAADGKLQGSMAAAYSTSATYAAGDYCIYDGQLYRCTTAITTAEAWTAAHWSAVALGDDTSDLRSALTSETEAREAADEALEASVTEMLSDYAKKDGTYEDLTSGNAEVLLSDVYTENSEPYLFRKTGGNGKREYLDKIVGGSLAWNQRLVMSGFSNTKTHNGITYTKNNDGTITASGRSTGLSYTYSDNAMIAATGANNSHVFYVKGCPTGGSVTTYLMYSGSNIQVTSDIGNGRILRGSTWNSTYLYVVGASSADQTVDLVFKPQLYDLTLMLGATIAEHILSLETATAGSGIAWLKQYIDLDTYHPYSVPTLKHVEGLVSHDTVGFNQLNEEWVNGYLDANGQYVVNENNITTANFSRVFPSTEYYFYCDSFNGTTRAYVAGYDENQNFVKYMPSSSGFNASSIITIPKEVHYIKVNMGSAYGKVYKNDICFNISDPTKNGTYKPYQKRSYPLDSSVVLRGVPTLVDGRLKFDGDEYQPSGVINRRYTEIRLDSIASSSWNMYTLYDQTIFRVRVDNLKRNGYRDAFISNKFVRVINPDQAMPSGGMRNYYFNSYNLEFYQDGITSVADWVAWLTANNAMLVFCSGETTEQAEPFRQLQICDTYGTEEFVTTSEVPVGTETRYPEDLKAKIEGLPWDLSMIAPIEDGTTASKAYTTGQYFLHNNVFCKALTSIASGATFTLNTNYTETTVAAELYTALH